jgi:FkbM family methyltransferase
MFQFQDWWLPDGESHMVEYMRVQPAYQGQHRATALSYVRHFRTAVDVGAHVGLWSRDLAARFERVHAFEPVAAHADCFERNVTAANVTLHRCALGREAGFVNAEVVVPGNSGTTQVFPSAGGLPMRTLDSFGLADVDFVKIDVEGAELLVCEGGAQTLARCRPVVILEQKKASEEYFGIGQYAARDFLVSIGAQVLARVKDDWILGWPERAAAGTP